LLIDANVVYQRRIFVSEAEGFVSYAEEQELENKQVERALTNLQTSDRLLSVDKLQFTGLDALRKSTKQQRAQKNAGVWDAYVSYERDQWVRGGRGDGARRARRGRGTPQRRG